METYVSEMFGCRPKKPVGNQDSPEVIRRRGLLLAGALAAFPGLSTAQKNTKQEILLGQSIDISGPGGNVGRDVVSGLNLYFDYLNSKGGVRGRRLRLETMDDAFNVDRAANNTKKLLGDPDLLALICPLGTTSTLRVSQEAGEVPVLFPITGTVGLRGKATPNTYYLRASYFEEVQAMVGHGVSVGFSRLALISSNDEIGKPGERAFMSAMSDKGMKPAVIGMLPDFKSRAFDVPIRQIIEAKPDAIVLYLTGNFADAVAALRKAGVLVPIYGLSVALNDQTLGQLGSASRGLMFTQIVPSFSNRKSRIVAEYLDHLRVTPHEPSFGGLEGFINAKVIVEAIQRAGVDPDRKKLVAALNSMSAYDAGDFQVDFGGGRRTGSKFVQIGVIDYKGKLLN